MRRPERLAEILRETIAEIVGYELNDPRLIGVTVTDVRVSDNLREAKVFVIVQGDENETKLALKSLHNAATFVRQQVAMSLDLRHAPVLNFVRDTVEENAIRVEELLQELPPQQEVAENEKE